ncbi:MAG: hypothetical protein EBZ29_00205 [Synechococcaceae bacterium WB9_4xC_028]|nr:hypothetical protein [Synechococcaceae bacterium WB9_4xC_028]
MENPGKQASSTNGIVSTACAICAERSFLQISFLSLPRAVNWRSPMRQVLWGFFHAFPSTDYGCLDWF